MWYNTTYFHFVTQLLIGYKRGIIVLWNQDKIKAEGTFKASQDLEGLYWHSDATQFISAHEHGNLSIWSIPEKEYGETVQDCTTPYGPFPCKAIRKVEWHEPYVIFSGGLPRASYGDKHAVSLMTGGTPQVVFDFTSNVIDFFTVKDSSGTGTLYHHLMLQELVLFIEGPFSELVFTRSSS